MLPPFDVVAPVAVRDFAPPAAVAAVIVVVVVVVVAAAAVDVGTAAGVAAPSDSSDVESELAASRTPRTSAPPPTRFLSPDTDPSIPSSRIPLPSFPPWLAFIGSVNVVVFIVVVVVAVVASFLSPRVFPPSTAVANSELLALVLCEGNDNGFS